MFFLMRLFILLAAVIIGGGYLINHSPSFKNQLLSIVNPNNTSNVEHLDSLLSAIDQDIQQALEQTPNQQTKQTLTKSKESLKEAQLILTTIKQESETIPGAIIGLISKAGNLIDSDESQQCPQK